MTGARLSLPLGVASGLVLEAGATTSLAIQALVEGFDSCSLSVKTSIPESAWVEPSTVSVDVFDGPTQVVSVHASPLPGEVSGWLVAELLVDGHAIQRAQIPLSISRQDQYASEDFRG